MRKDKRNRDVIKPNIFDRICNTRYVFSVKGLNQDMLLEKLNKSNINVFNVKKENAKTMHITIYFGDFQKFFAITKEMCYNIKKEKEYGTKRVLYYLSRHVGYVIGVFVLAIIPAIVDGYIFDYSFYGSGSVYYRQVKDYLIENGVNKFSRFDDIDYKALSNGILMDNENLSFVSVYKSGNRLKIELIASEKAGKKLCGDKTKLISDLNGQVEYIKVYRGTVLVEAGQSVKEGDVLVDGYYKQNESVVSVNVIATACILTECKFEFTDSFGDRQEYYKTIVSNELQDYDIIDYNVEIKREGNNNKYIITARYRYIISCG